MVSYHTEMAQIAEMLARAHNMLETNRHTTDELRRRNHQLEEYVQGIDQPQLHMEVPPEESSQPAETNEGELAIIVATLDARNTQIAILEDEIRGLKDTIERQTKATAKSVTRDTANKKSLRDAEQQAAKQAEIILDLEKKLEDAKMKLIRQEKDSNLLKEKLTAATDQAHKLEETLRNSFSKYGELQKKHAEVLIMMKLFPVLKVLTDTKSDIQGIILTICKAHQIHYNLARGSPFDIKLFNEVIEELVTKRHMFSDEMYTQCTNFLWTSISTAFMTDDEISDLAKDESALIFQFVTMCPDSDPMVKKMSDTLIAYYKTEYQIQEISSPEIIQERFRELTTGPEPNLKVALRLFVEQKLCEPLNLPLRHDMIATLHQVFPGATNLPKTTGDH